MQEQITIQHVAVTVTRSPVGDTTRTEAAPVPVVVQFAPRSSNERSDQRSPAVISGATLYGPAGWNVGPDDHFTIKGAAWEVEGDVGDWGSMGTEVAVTKWTNG